MNVPKAIEKAVATMIRTYAEVGADTVIRPFQALNWDGSWDRDNDRQFPAIEARFSPERTDESQLTFVCEGMVRIGTYIHEDKDHRLLATYFEQVRDVLHEIYMGFWGQVSEAKYAEFKALIETELGGTFAIGGITFGEPLAPYDDGNANLIGIGLNIHFSL